MLSLRVFLPIAIFGSAVLARAQDYSFRVLAGARAVEEWIDGAGTQARFNTPEGLAFDTVGNLYVADHFNGIRKITPAGMVTTLAAAGWVEQLAIDATGTVYASVGSQIVKVSPSGDLTVLAGSGYADAVDGRGTDARFAHITGLAVDASGNVFVADATYTSGAGLSAKTFRSNVIRRVAPDGTVTTIAGQIGTSGNVDAAGTAARFADPEGIVRGADGNLYVEDAGNSSIRRVTRDGVVTTFVSGTALATSRGLASGPSGSLYTSNGNDQMIYRVTSNGDVATVATFKQYSRTSGIAVSAAGHVFAAIEAAIIELTPTQPVVFAGAPDGWRQIRDGWGRDASFADPIGFGIDHAGNAYVVDSAVVRRISPSGIVTTIATLPFTRTGGIASDGDTLYVSDDDHGIIYKVGVDGSISEFAGSQATGSVLDPSWFTSGTGYVDGVGPAAHFAGPRGLAVDASHNVYVADYYSHVIRKITPDRRVTTLAGRPGAFGYADGPAATAQFHHPLNLAVDAAGNVYVTDTYNFVIRKITPDGTVSTVAGTPGTQTPFDAYLGGIVVDADNNVLFSDGGIWKLMPDGTLSRVPSTYEYVRMKDYRGDYGSLGIAPDGRIYQFMQSNLEVGMINPAPARLANLSIRGEVGAAAGTLTAGFVVKGGTKSVLVRAVGPTMAEFGVPNAASATRLDLFHSTTALDENTGWSSFTRATDIATVSSRVGAFSLPAGSLDSALLEPLDEGAYTGVVAAGNGARGAALAEIYDADATPSESRLINLSARASVGPSSRTLIAGLSIVGDQPETVLIRAAGPSLSTFGVADAIGATKLELYSGGTIIASNQGWNTEPHASQLPTTFRQVGAFPFAVNSGDSALLVTLQPGTYTVHLTAADNSAGTALAEIYEVAQ